MSSVNSPPATTNGLRHEIQRLSCVSRLKLVDLLVLLAAVLGIAWNMDARVVEADDLALDDDRVGNVDQVLKHAGEAQRH